MTIGKAMTISDEEGWLIGFIEYNTKLSLYSCFVRNVDGMFGYSILLKNKQRAIEHIKEKWAEVKAGEKE